MILLGALGVRYRSFLISDVVGTIMWASVYVVLGYLLGPPWYHDAVQRVGPEGVLVLLALALVGAAYYAYRHRRWFAHLGRVARHAQASGNDQPPAAREVCASRTGQCMRNA